MDRGGAGDVVAWWVLALVMAALRVWVLERWGGVGFGETWG